ncbi:uncharacterized protein LOC111073364 isoform X2 [Drosophila obscura]|uniref:uncharacterized protein LOC111073364 isoform X2 n=1 Tax=Drosophila obscura TaxID=7282 RepID=UPI001BB1CF05|nr:uncharacterized protein LOC111073364 isoform X2 [Drosophila obscura]
MLLLRIYLLYSIVPFLLLHAYPMAQHAQRYSEPHNYPDLTAGLTDGEVQAALDGLSLEDLNRLDRLLDEHSNHDEDANTDSEASQGNQFRQAKGSNEQVFDDLLASEDHLDDGCKDEDEGEEKKPKNLCTKRPPCPNSTRLKTGQTTCEPPDSTSECPHKKTSSKNKPDDENMDSPVDMSKCQKTKKKPSKPKPTVKSDEDCNADDFECLERFRERDYPKMWKHSPLDYDEERADGSSAYVPPQELAGIEQLDEEILMPFLDGELKEDPVEQGEWKPMAAEGEEEAEAPLEHTETYERHRLSRMAHRKRKHAKAQQEKPIPYDPMEERPQLTAADSFLASNEREPMRYLIQMENGNIESPNELGEQRLREDHSQSENLTLQKRTQEMNSDSQGGQDPNEYFDFRRMKRENKRTDDAPDNSKETYMKKLMDSFPRDQGGQSNDDMEALQESISAHLRVKRS